MVGRGQKVSRGMWLSLGFSLGAPPTHTHTVVFLLASVTPRLPRLHPLLGSTTNPKAHYYHPLCDANDQYHNYTAFANIHHLSRPCPHHNNGWISPRPLRAFPSPRHYKSHALCIDVPKECAIWFGCVCVCVCVCVCQWVQLVDGYDSLSPPGSGHVSNVARVTISSLFSASDRDTKVLMTLP